MELSAKQIQKYKNKTVPQLIKLAEKKFNAYIRKRDEGQPCISCKTYTTSGQAGHYMSAGHHAATRFYENNVHLQCVRCNCFLHGNLLNYRKNLIKKIGEEEVIKIESMSKLSFKWDRFELIAIIEKYSSFL